MRDLGPDDKATSSTAGQAAEGPKPGGSSLTQKLQPDQQRAASAQAPGFEDVVAPAAAFDDEAEGLHDEEHDEGHEVEASDHEGSEHEEDEDDDADAEGLATAAAEHEDADGGNEEEDEGEDALAAAGGEHAEAVESGGEAGADSEHAEAAGDDSDPVLDALPRFDHGAAGGDADLEQLLNGGEGEHDEDGEDGDRDGVDSEPQHATAETAHERHEGDDDDELDGALTPQGEGRALEPAIKHELEAETGYRLDHVRVHVGGQTGDVLAKGGKLGATKGRNILFPDGGYRPTDPAGKDLIRHEINHVVQQGSGQVSGTLDAGQRAGHEADADRKGPGRRGELRELSPRANGPAQFRAAYDGPPPTVKRSKPRAAPPPPPPRAAPRPAPRPVYRAPVGDQHYKPRAAPTPVRRPAPKRPAYRAPVGDQHYKERKPAPPKRPAYRAPVGDQHYKDPKPKPVRRPAYKAPVGDQHWNDANLRGQAVANRRLQAARDNAAAAARQRRIDGSYTPRKLPKLSKRDRQDLKAFERSEQLSNDGVQGVRREREAKRKAEEAAKQKEDKGWGPFQVAHKVLNVAGNVPIVGSLAGAADTALHGIEVPLSRTGWKWAKKDNAIQEFVVSGAGTAAGFIPLPGMRAAGKKIAGGAARAVTKQRKGAKTFLPKNVKVPDAKQLERAERRANQNANRARDRIGDPAAKAGGVVDTLKDSNATKNAFGQQVKGRPAQDGTDAVVDEGRESSARDKRAAERAERRRRRTKPRAEPRR